MVVNGGKEGTRFEENKKVREEGCKEARTGSNLRVTHGSMNENGCPCWAE
jgi:hypothetical protein